MLVGSWPSALPFARHGAPSISEAAIKLPRMTVDEFVAWSETQPGRYELFDGRVVTMRSERAAHNLAKLSVAITLRAAVRAAAAPCTVFSDGITVRIDERTAFEPDAVVHCGGFDTRSTLVTNPAIVVEVISPSSGRSDMIRKFADYFRLATVRHYLLADTASRIVIHHQRDGEKIASRIRNRGELRLDPPGITV